MGQKQTGAFCAHCQRNVLAVGTTPNHVLHLLLSVFTAGLWLIPWIVISISSAGGFRCTQCGNPV